MSSANAMNVRRAVEEVYQYAKASRIGTVDSFSTIYVVSGPRPMACQGGPYRDILAALCVQQYSGLPV